MKITVIIPIYNTEDLSLNAIKSIKEQSYKVDEIIIIDDGSKYKSKKLFENENIKYVYQTNKGVSSARNLGIKLAKNNWLAFLDSDDTWEPDKIEEHISFHKNHKNILASYTSEIWIRNNKIKNLNSKQKKEIPSFTNSLRLCKIGTSTFFCHKSIFKNIGLFDESLLACEDYDLWLRVLLKYDIGFIDKNLTKKYAGHDNQLSFSTKLIDKYRIKALEKHINTQYKDEVIQELLYKINILLKGAKKRNNDEMIKYCEIKLKLYNKCERV